MGRFHPFFPELSTCSTLYSVNLSGYSPNLIYALILWRSALGLLIGKFCQFLTELSTSDMIMVGYYCFTFYFPIFIKSASKCRVCQVHLFQKHYFSTLGSPFRHAVT